MTYNELIARIKVRARPIVKGSIAYDDGIIYEALNTAAREIAVKAKDNPSTATLSLIAGTRDYTISSAIASDVDEIQLLVTDTGEINLLSVEDFQNKIHETVVDEDDIEDGTTEWARIWNGVLRVFPTPSESISVTVYYTVKIPTSFHSSVNGAASIELDDIYIDAIMYEAIAQLCEMTGNEGRATYYRGESLRRLDDAQAHKPIQSFGETVNYQDGIN